MITKEQLKSPEFSDSMVSLENLLKKRGVSYTIKQHAGADPRIKKIIGYYPTGQWHIVINGEFSVIRGMTSWGLFEVMNIKGGDLFKEPERFATPQELIDALPITTL